MKKKFKKVWGRHSRVDLSLATIMRPRIRIASTISKLYIFEIFASSAIGFSTEQK